MSSLPMRPALRLIAAILAGKAAALASRAFGRGGGTTLPGVVARRIEPVTLARLCALLPQGVPLVAGTNGKTTTTRMVAAALAAADRRVLHNRAGANLVSGLTATALAGSGIDGRPRADIGLFETDEAALPQVIAETAPRLVLLHNLFRDQLDRYGEIDTIAANWRAALATLGAGATVLLNADDPAVAMLGEGLTARVRYYGIDDLRHAAGGGEHIADAQFCRACGTRYQYLARFYAHVGHYRCPGCGRERPTPHYRLARIEPAGIGGARLLLGLPDGGMEMQLPLPGLYNAANALAAVATARELDTPAGAIRQALEGFSAAFGRIERIDAAGRPLLVALIKNPVGASETVRMLVEASSAAAGLHMLVVINDRHADGTDVSWLWDAEFERLAGVTGRVVVSGTRAADMAVRLKYAGIDPARMTVVEALPAALDTALAQLPPGAMFCALPTYTAMLELRTELVRRGWARPFWED
ncbi:MAG TPA: MurT ligase domain-containing protein [Roseiflexaceae bacterium]|nr:MurT ligase domain-containing protein [Roseiflexaceae bacterium]